MIQLSDEQLNNLGKEALIVIASSLQDQLLALQSQLDHANAQLSHNNRQIELLTEQIRIMNQRFFGRQDFRHASSNIHFPPRNWPPVFLTVTRNFRKKFINAFTSFRKHLSWMNIMSMSMPPKVMTGLS